MRRKPEHVVNARTLKARKISKKAAEWVMRLAAATDDERKGFVHWLKQSPDHLLEFLLAMVTDRMLIEHFQNCRKHRHT